MAMEVSVFIGLKPSFRFAIDGLDSVGFINDVECIGQKPCSICYSSP